MKFNFFNRKSQITIFILIGIILILVGGFVLILNKSSYLNFFEDNNVNNNQVQSIKNFIETCITSETESVLTYISLQGGYYGIPDNYIEYSLNNLGNSLLIPYYLQFNQDLFISEDRLISELKYGLQQNIDKCYDYKGLRYEYSLEKLSIKDYVINNNSISLFVQNLGKIYYNDLDIEFPEFLIEITYPLNDFLRIANEFNNIQKEYGSKICESCFLRILNNTDFRFSKQEIFMESGYVIIYGLKEQNTSKLFNFAHKINYSFKKKSNNDFNFNSLESLTAKIGYEFNYKFDSICSNCFFYDDTNLFDIDRMNGEINFIPVLEDVGVHYITIYINDSYGVVDERILRLEIENFGVVPELDFIGFLNGYVNQDFYYKSNGSSKITDKLFFLDDSNLFDINKTTGVINFTPSSNDVGIHKFNITLLDSFGNYDKKVGTLIIS
jgi:hypothetical protein